MIIASAVFFMRLLIVIVNAIAIGGISLTLLADLIGILHLDEYRRAICEERITLQFVTTSVL